MYVKCAGKISHHTFLIIELFRQRRQKKEACLECLIMPVHLWEKKVDQVALLPPEEYQVLAIINLTAM